MKLRTMADIRVAKERLRYSVLLQETALISVFQNLSNAFVESVKASFRNFGRKLLMLTLIKFFRKNKKS